MTPEERATRFADRTEAMKVIEAEREKVKYAALHNKCPKCNRGVRRNPAITGAWRCEFFDRGCDWQGHAE